MKLAEWTMGICIVFSVGLFLITVFTSDPWSDHQYSSVPPIAEAAVSPHGDARDKMVCSTCHKVIRQNVGLAGGFASAVPVAFAQRPVQIPRRTATMGNMGHGGNGGHHGGMGVNRFQGRISRVVNGSSSAAGSLNILVDDGVNAPSWYSLAPMSYLKAKGCNVSAGMFIKGEAFFDVAAVAPSMRQGKSISVNGAFCGLRDSHMVGFWQAGAEIDEEGM